MKALRFTGLLLALSVSGLALAAEPALPTDPRQRLEALQHALVKAAMAGQTRVRSAAYIDSSGSLHETTRITSDMKVRGVRVLSYLDDEGSASANIVAEGKAVTRNDEACRASMQKYRREATLETAVRFVATGSESYDINLLISQARARLVAQAGVSRKWLLTTPSNMPESSYERLLTGAQADYAPYQMMLELLPAGAQGVQPLRVLKTANQQAAEMLKTARDYVMDEPEKRAALPFVLRLSVTERSGHKLLWQDAVPLTFPEIDIKSTGQPLPPLLALSLDRVLQNWLSQLDANFGCRPLQFNVMQEAPAGWIINGGQAAGLSVGDQLLLLDRDHLPARILEPDSAQHMALVEVVKVSSGLATVRKLAGPAVMPKAGDWVATPF
jgi:hypothetical protein